MTSFEIYSVLGMVVSLCFVAISNLLLRKTNKDAHDWNRRKAAQDIAISYGELNPDRELISEFLKKESTLVLLV